ncbi:hypothetical protein CU669_03520 [Paramagnetospirillum kuznetsovii]|uniref:Tyrosine specific protein phosphatases domain-containing protein n=1 Tax=Paramagnetospirillum kuznetsovii TaxID=2053833 RepID=A0A364P2H4_9PROT|nr:dual specificity protein phosphatase family protein [Paramagnetospirillum kuznetsovii]RAU23486.1 hypothetical protein CU669_03520 [Paramagnetospirillum kuznetsovii]
MTMGKLPFELSICGLDELDDELESFAPTHVVSILDPGEDDHDPLIFPESMRVLSLRFYDFHAMGGLVGKALARQGRSENPSIDHADAILAFGREIPKGSRVLCHCWAGVSRSTAAAFLLACLHLTPDDAMELVMTLRPGAVPNRLIVRFADRILGAGGKMVSASDDHRRGVGSRSIRSIKR